MRKKSGIDTIKDRDAIKKELDNSVTVGEQLFEKGEKYRKDIETINKEVERVKNSKLSATDKTKFLEALEQARELIEAEYQEKVEDKRTEVQDYMQVNLEEAQEQIVELEITEECLNEMQMEAMGKDKTVGTFMTEVQDQKQKFEDMKDDYTEKLKLQIEQARIQRQNVFKKQLGGK